MKFLPLTVLTFLFLLSSVLVLTLSKKNIESPLRASNQEIPFDVNALPILQNPSKFPVLSAQGVLAVDYSSGTVLYEKNSDQKMYPASTTKIMTALVALDYYRNEDILTIGRLNTEGQVMRLVQGEQISFENLFSGLLIYSANDAAEALAQNYPGGRNAFISAMNTKAQALHLQNTHFANPTGLDTYNHYSTPKDLIRLSQVAMQNQKFVETVGTKEKIVTNIDGTLIHPLKNINELLGKVEGVQGIKTGWTEEARENLVTYINRDDKKIYIALLGSSDRFGETEELITWIFTNYTWTKTTYSP